MRFQNLLDTSSYTPFSLLCFSIVACSSTRNSYNENEGDSKILKVNPTTINISANATMNIYDSGAINAIMDGIQTSYPD
ncbi:MAG: hypothetical protein GX416_13110 [Bacteroidales bacterium]|nr:hypothetical protein [Bacteroidales bacterium]